MERELSDYTSLRGEKIHRNNFRVSLPRCRAVRAEGNVRSMVFKGTMVCGEAELEIVPFYAFAFVLL